MRIAVAYWSNRLAGGASSYLADVLPALRAAGHEVGLLHELDAPTDRPLLPTPDGTPRWSTSDLGPETALASLRAWRPDLLYVHGLHEPSIERRLLDVAPAVFFAHEYHGTCISGEKTFRYPTPTPCGRPFGWSCLAHYYPRRCGGLNPVTAVRLFGRQRERLELLSRYAAIVTHSAHMRREYVRQGFEPSRVLNVRCGSGATVRPAVRRAREHGPQGQCRLLFVGRMVRLKGGAELLRAMPDVARRLQSRMSLVFAGDGPERASWEQLAGTMPAAGIDVTFEGWTDAARLGELYAAAHLLVVPSLWPEPLGLVGLEAARHGLPVVAFDVGGISDWLTPGVNGFLAPGNPPTISGLADAIVACLADPDVYARLCASAAEPSSRFSSGTHVELLSGIFARVTALRAGQPAPDRVTPSSEADLYGATP